MASPLDFLHRRLSVPSRQLGAPAPDPDQLHDLLQAAVRVPDHGKRVPFRMIELRDGDLRRFGELLAERALQRDPALSDARLEKERTRYAFAPLVVVVVARVTPDSKVPAIEQQLAAGCVAYNLLLGAQALGFGAQWLTGWAAYDDHVAALLGLSAGESVIGFVHIGTARLEVPERERPDARALLSRWSP